MEVNRDLLTDFYQRSSVEDRERSKIARLEAKVGTYAKALKRRKEMIKAKHKE